MSLLSLSQVTADYGASQALFGVDLTVGEGEVVALMGRNGMGKSTTVRAICRMVTSQGTMRFAGQDISGLSSHAVARLGVGLVPETRRAFRDLTVRENLLAVARPGHWDFAKVVALFPRLQERSAQRAGSLSGGEQQMLVIGRALITNPRLLILDEATEGLSPLIRQEIWTSIAQLKHETGLSILVIDKSLKELRQICDRATVLERGRSVWDGPISDLDSETSRRFLGV
ncbi:MAG: ABC transporter ATP-binding protein [Rhodobacteraceae bacterium]|nr:ABC transporter ATP-binding protein [Paracoccaceae bacterium]